MENKFLKIDNKNKWQDLLNKVFFKTFFHNTEWEELLERNFNWLKFEHYFYQDKVLLSLARCKIGDKEKLVSHPFCEYGGPLFLAENIDGEQFKQDLLEQFKGSLQISFHPALSKSFTESLLTQSGRVSYFVKYPSNLRKTTRHELEKAQKQNLQIKKCENKKELNSFYNLYIKSVKRHRIPAYPFSFFEYFLNSPDAEIILAKKDNNVIGGSVFLFYGDLIHYFQNAIDQRYKNLGANYLIIQHQLQKYPKRVFDFGGTRKGSPLEVFKKGWGGQEQSIYELINYKKTDFRGSKLRNIFGLLPPFLIKKLSPYLLKYKI